MSPFTFAARRHADALQVADDAFNDPHHYWHQSDALLAFTEVLRRHEPGAVVASAASLPGVVLCAWCPERRWPCPDAQAALAFIEAIR